LSRWNKEFEVSLFEKHRNQAIYRIQGNRNPFIDFPDLAEKIQFPID
jgi:deoxyribonuclease I